MVLSHSMALAGVVDLVICLIAIFAAVLNFLPQDTLIKLLPKNILILLILTLWITIGVLNYSTTACEESLICAGQFVADKKYESTRFKEELELFDQTSVTIIILACLGILFLLLRLLDSLKT